MSSTQPLYEESQSTYSRARRKLTAGAIVGTFCVVIILANFILLPQLWVSNLFLLVVWVPISAHSWLKVRIRQRFRVYADSLEPAVRPLSTALGHKPFGIRADEVEQVRIDSPLYRGTWPESITLLLRSGKEIALDWPGKDAHAPVRGFVDRLVATGGVRLATPIKLGK